LERRGSHAHSEWETLKARLAAAGDDELKAELQLQVHKKELLMQFCQRQLEVLKSIVNSPVAQARPAAAPAVPDQQRNALKLKLLLYKELHFPKLHRQTFVYALRGNIASVKMLYTIRQQFENECQQLRLEKESISHVHTLAH